MNFPLHTIDSIRRFDSEKIGDESYLISLDFKVIPFTPIRLFSVSSGKGSTRGNHAHKKCTQAFFSIKGSFRIECINKTGKKTLWLLLIIIILSLIGWSFKYLNLFVAQY